MSSVVVVGPEDSVTRRIAERLAASPGVASCRVLSGPRAAHGYDEELAAGCDVAVYRPPLAGGTSATPDAGDARHFLTAWERAARPGSRLVLVSSSVVYEPRHDHPGHVLEGHRTPGRNPIAHAWLLLEGAAARHRGAGELLVLRAAPAAAADAGDFWSRLLGGRLAVTLAGHDPSLQLLAPDDLAEAVRAAVQREPRPDADAASAEVPDVYHVAPAGVVPVRWALRVARVRRLPLDVFLQRPLRALAARFGLSDPPEQLEYVRYPWTVSGEKAARELGFLSRRTSAEAIADAFASGRLPEGMPSRFDDFGMDPAYIAAYGRTLFRFLARVWWRIELRGLDHLPPQGRAVLVGVHRGFMPWDGVMTLHMVRASTGRIVRFLIHPALVKFPFLANYMTKLGGLAANQENAERVLGDGELLGFFPEGIRGAFAMYRDAYTLGKFGRDEFVRTALRNRAPIVPFVTVGSAEIFPILAKVEWTWWKRLTEWPFLPITPTFPLLPVPLPSKWHMQFLEPIPVHERYGPEAAADPAVVRAISREVRERILAGLADMLARRRSIFWGDIWTAEERAAELRPRRREAA